ncbi:right-handed parallel beta-helix repeat-containing protein [Bacillus massiliglaciei]|uniref:right-handed parallel beta-helix repeat-containing protein n=1 Tax=Bacillus massiliglaciei TaxID=1816693 RepID=UPI000DA62CF5|nr:right-handed parallel beta-helix repeat-containing protein [Bacillus massiliglaciei]
MADINEHLNKIKTAVFGQDVRGSLVDGLEEINKETQSATDLTKHTESRQSILEMKYNEQIANSTDITEVKDFHVSGVTGKVFQTMGQRADELDGQLATIGVQVEPFKNEQNSWADAIESAINMSYRKTIQLPPYLMELDRPVKAINGLTVLGKKKETYITSKIQMDSAFTASDDISDVSFDGVGFTGGVIDEGQKVPRRKRTTVESFDTAIHFAGDLMPGESHAVRNISISNCDFKNIASLPVLLQGIRGYARIINNDFDNCLDIGYTHCENVFFNNNSVSRSADNGVSISRKNKNIVCNANIINTSAYCGIWLSGWMGGEGNNESGPSNFTCVGNIVNDSGWNGIQLADAPKNGIVSGNIINGVRKGPVDGPDDGKGIGIGVYPYPSSTYPITPENVEDYARNIGIFNNVIMNAARGGIYIRGLLVGQCSHNMIIDCGSNKKADGFTDAVPLNNENFGILLDVNSGITIQDLLVESNIIIDKRTDTMKDGTRILNFPLLMGYAIRCTFKGNKAYGTEHVITDGLKQDGTNSNNIENLMVAIASKNAGANNIAFTGADAEGEMRMGILKRYGFHPFMATASGIPFEVYRMNTVSVIDPNATYEKLMKIDKEPSSNQPALFLGNGNENIRLDIDPVNDGTNGFRTEKYFTAAAGLRTNSSYLNGLHMGGYRIFIDGSGNLRYKFGKPNSSNDGKIILTIDEGDELVNQGGLACQSTYNGGHFRMGNFHIWIDASGNPRIKNGKPTSDTDGKTILTQ